MKPNYLFFSLDIESDGPVPGINSMLQLGCAAFLPGRVDPFVGGFERNLHPLLPIHGAMPDGETLRWWRKYPLTYQELQENRHDPQHAIISFANWMRELLEKHQQPRPIVLAWPTRFDEAFVHWYHYRFRVEMAYTHHDVVDLRSLWCAREMARRGEPWFCDSLLTAGIPKHWACGHEHKHTALADATEQGYILMSLLHDLTQKGEYLSILDATGKERGAPRDFERKAGMES